MSASVFSDESTLETVAREIRDHCCCKLGKTRTKGVPGEGNPHAQIVFVGEAPGYNEDQQGKPFVGNAGKFLDEMLESIDLKRDDVFITNIVKCRPPNNRDPEDEEKIACQGYLERQIQLISPKLIVCLGRHSLGYFLPGMRISQIHGQPKRRGKRVVMPLYHPAAALHNQSLRETLQDDFMKIPAVLEKIAQLEQEQSKPRPESVKPEPDQKQLPLL